MRVFVLGGSFTGCSKDQVPNDISTISNETDGVYEFPIEDSATNNRFENFVIRFPAGRGTQSIRGLAPSPPSEDCPTSYDADFFQRMRDQNLLGEICNVCENFLDDGDSPDCGQDPVGTLKTSEILSAYCDAPELTPDYFDESFWCNNSVMPCEDATDDNVLEHFDLNKPDR